MKQIFTKKAYVAPVITTMEIQMNACFLTGTLGGNTGGDNMGNGGEFGRSHNEESSPWNYEQ